MNTQSNSSEPRDIAVIGAGIVGMSCALFLQRDGHRVTVIDPVDPGSDAQTSFGNAGSISMSSVMPTALPGMWRKLPKMLIDPTGPLAIRWRYLPTLAPFLASFLRHTTRERVAVNGRAIAALIHGVFDAYDTLVADTGTQDLIIRRGSLKVYKTERSFAAAAFERKMLADNGFEFEILNSDELRQLEPGLAPIFEHAMYLPQSGGATNPGQLVRRFAESFAARGGAIHRAPATGFRFAEGSVRAVVTGSGDIAADAVVLAAGSWSRGLARQLGAPVRLEAERGYHVMLANPPVALRRFIMFADAQFALGVHEDGLRVTTGVEYASVDAPPDYRRIRALLPKVAESVRDLDISERSIWMGRRPTLPNSVPMIARSPRHANAYFAFGHSHLGLTMGPVTGRIIADLVADRDPGINMTPYRVNR
jgi:D-amino-acid dehydrogenase